MKRNALLAEQDPKALMADVVDHPLGDREVRRLGRTPGRERQTGMVSQSSSLPGTKTSWSAPAFAVFVVAPSCPRETSPAEAMATVVATAAEARIPAPAMVSRTCNFDLRLVCLLTLESLYLAATVGR